jgi:hypothetical protein
LTEDEQLELELLAQIAMATDAQSLLTQGVCYACYGASAFEIMKLSLLAQISIAHNPSNDVTPAALIVQARCYVCNTGQLTMARMMELSLLAQIAT